MANSTKPFLAIYKVVRSFKLKHHGRVTTKQFVWCRAIFAKNYVIRHELVRCRSKRPAKQDAVQVNAIWIDSIPDPRIEEEKAKVEEEAKAKKAKAETAAKPKRKKIKRGKL